MNSRIPLELLNKSMHDSLIGHMGIEITSVSKGEIKATMPVDSRTMRPGGILHGGSSLVLAETVAGLGSMLLIDATEYDARGIQVNGSHVGGMREGTVFATATIVHEGKQTHVWNVDMTNSEGKLISTVRVTNMIVKKNE